MNTTLPTRHSEISFYTSDPASMLFKYIADDVMKIWTQQIADSDTGEIINIERSERLFNRGTFIDQNTLESIRFCMDAGEIRRIRVSNQCRLAKETTSFSHVPFKAKATIQNKPHTFILYAKSLRTALLILADYIELNFEGRFAITEIRATDYLTILTDPGYVLPDDEIAQPTLPDEDSPVNSEHEIKSEQDKEEAKNQRFYQITAHITTITRKDKADDKWEYDKTFLVQTTSCARANRIILFWLRLSYLKEIRARQTKDPDYTPEEKTFLSQVEESKVVPIRHYIPSEFSQAYSDYDQEPNGNTTPLPEESCTVDTPAEYSKKED